MVPIKALDCDGIILALLSRVGVTEDGYELRVIRSGKKNLTERAILRAAQMDILRSVPLKNEH